METISATGRWVVSAGVIDGLAFFWAVSLVCGCGVMPGRGFEMLNLAIATGKKGQYRCGSSVV